MQHGVLITQMIRCSLVAPRALLSECAGLAWPACGLVRLHWRNLGSCAYLLRAFAAGRSEREVDALVFHMAHAQAVAVRRGLRNWDLGGHS